MKVQKDRRKKELLIYAILTPKLPAVVRASERKDFVTLSGKYDSRNAPFLGSN